MEICAKSIYVTQFPEDEKFWICRCSESNQGFPLIGVETKEGAESLGRRVAGILGVTFYASRARDLWSEGKGEHLNLFTMLRVKKTFSDECGLYIEDQSGNCSLLFASENPDEIAKYASEMSELLNVPVKTDVSSYKGNILSRIGGKKMSRSDVVDPGAKDPKSTEVGEVEKESKVKVKRGPRVTGILDLCNKLIDEGKTSEVIEVTLVKEYTTAGYSEEVAKGKAHNTYLGQVRFRKRNKK